jgi:adenylosuccinate synthase
MANVIVVGTQWGDEGKAKIIDYLTRKSDIIIRFQGGANAGHTVVVNGKKFVFHLVPSGIMDPDKVCIVGNGVVFDAEQFLVEVEEIKAMGLSVEKRLFVSDLAQMVLPYHKVEDSVAESAKGSGKIGTTGRGIGPAYADKVSRSGIRVGELADWDSFTRKFSHNFSKKKQLVADYFKADLGLDESAILERYRLLRERMLPFIADTGAYLFGAVQQKKQLLFEGAQGSFLDIDHGTYPYVTSSNTIAGSACTGSGVGPTVIDHVVGIVKAYTTRVGNGPFPTELNDATGEELRRIGGEFGATTGRPRRCGWFDSVMVRKAAQLSGLTRLALTKIDVLNSLDEIKICTHYEIDGKRIEQFPSDTTLLERAKPVYESMPGWKTDLAGCTNYGDLPSKAIAYIERLRALCYNLPVLIVSVGPDRRETIEVEALS